MSNNQQKLNQQLQPPVEADRPLPIKKKKKRNDYKITTRQREFIEELILNGHNQKQAALIAGYPKGRAPSINSCPAMWKYHRERLAEFEEKLQITANWKANKLRQIILKALPDNDEEGKPNYSAVISAISELNKMQGHYSAEKHVNTNLNVDTDMIELVELIKKYKSEY